MKAPRSDLGDDDAFQEAAKAIQCNHPEWCGRHVAAFCTNALVIELALFDYLSNSELRKIMGMKSADREDDAPRKQGRVKDPTRDRALLKIGAAPQDKAALSVRMKIGALPKTVKGRRDKAA